MKDTKRPDAPELRAGDDHSADRPSAGELATFSAVLLGSFGLGSLVDFLRRRAARKRRERQQEQQAQREADHQREVEQLRAMRHENKDVRVRRVGLVGLGMIVGAVVMFLALGGLFAWFASRAVEEDASIPPLALTPQTPPGPRLQVAPPADLAQLRATEQARLESYGWVDQRAQVAHIPIERAMALIAQRGLPARSGAPGGAAPQPTGIPGAGQNVPETTSTPAAATATPAPAAGSRP